MSLRQREIRIRLMVEADRLPTPYIVAVSAGGSISPFVDIVGLVAGVAITTAAIPEVGGAMAVHALQSLVAEFQRESGNGEMTECQLCP